MEFFPAEGESRSQKEIFAGCTLVFPAVAAANVGQLAIDLIVSTLEMPRVGYLEHPHVLPCVGNDAYAPSTTGTPAQDRGFGNIATTIEVYNVPGKNLVVIQQRAPVAPGRQGEFAEDMASWVREQRPGKVVMLAGLHAKWRTEQRVGLGLQLCYLSSAHSLSPHPRCAELGFAPLSDAEYSHEKIKDSRTPPWPLFCALQSDPGLDLVCLLAFCSEGDNIPEGGALAQMTADLLALDPSPPDSDGPPCRLQWRMPPSWGHLYGPAPDLALY